MSNESVIADDVNSAEEVDTSDTTVASDTEADAAVETVDATEEESPYKIENERLEAESRQKAGALKEERERRKVAEQAAAALVKANEEEKSKTKGLTAEETDKLLEEKLSKRDFDQFISQVSSDPEEQKLVKHHYDTSIVKTGNVSEDLKKAVAIANLHLIEKTKQEEAERNQAEAGMTRFTAGKPFNKMGKPAYETDPGLKAAAAFLEKMGAKDAIKHLGK